MHVLYQVWSQPKEHCLGMLWNLEVWRTHESTSFNLSEPHLVTDTSCRNGVLIRKHRNNVKGKYEYFITATYYDRHGVSNYR